MQTANERPSQKDLPQFLDKPHQEPAVITVYLTSLPVASM